MNWMYVFIGGGMGSMARYALSEYFEPSKLSFPIGTLSANLLACFILGILLGLQLKGNLQNANALLLITGFCGGFSTFSTFSNESLKLIQNQQVGLALIYIGGSIVLGLIAVYFGIRVQNNF